MVPRGLDLCLDVLGWGSIVASALESPRKLAGVVWYILTIVVERRPSANECVIENRMRRCERHEELKLSL